MVRRQKRVQTSRRRTRRATRHSRLTLGGPNSTPNPAVTVTQTLTFDLTGNTNLTPLANAVPERLALYAMCPRDTDAKTTGTQNALAQITAILRARNPDTASITGITLQENITVLPWNGGIRKVLEIDYKKLLAAGLNIPVQNTDSNDYFVGISLTLGADTAPNWAGSPINMFVVYEHSFSLSFGPGVSTITLDSSGVSVAEPLRVIDSNVRASRLFTNDAVKAFRARTALNQATQSQNIRAGINPEKYLGPLLIAVEHVNPTGAGAAEAHVTA